MDITIGIILGVLLSAATVCLHRLLEINFRRRIHKQFARDIVTNISKYVEKLDNKRKKDNFIERDFLDFIEIETNTFGRNREHLSILEDDELKSDLHDFISDVMIFMIRARNDLDNYYRLQSSNNPDENKLAGTALERSKMHCDSLWTHISSKAPNLIKRLN